MKKLLLLILIIFIFSVATVWAQNAGSLAEDLEKTAQAGDAESQRLLGYMYWLGNEVPQDDVKAFEWLLQAAGNGDVTAQKAVSGFYYIGTGITQDFAKAFEWMERAAQTGDAEAQLMVAQYYYEGRGVERNVEKTVEWLEKSAVQGNDKALQVLSDINAQAAEVIKAQSGKMTPTNEAEALYQAALAHFQGNGVPQDLVKAFELAHQAVEQGSADACVLIGNIYTDGRVVTRNFNKALEYYLKAAENNHVQAQYFLSIMYYDGRGTAVDFVEAYKWALIAWDNVPGSEVIKQQLQIIRNRMTASAASKGQFLAEKWLKENK